MLHQLEQQNKIDATIYNFRPVKRGFVKNIRLEVYLRNVRVFAESIFQSNMTTVSEDFQVCGIVPLLETILKNGHSNHEKQRLLKWRYMGLSPVSIYN
jgi:hypothetical protein